MVVEISIKNNNDSCFVGIKAETDAWKSKFLEGRNAVEY